MADKGKVKINIENSSVYHPDSVNGALKKLKMATRVTLKKLNFIYLFKCHMVTRFAPENIFA